MSTMNAIKRRPGTIDEAPGMAMNQKASIVAEAAAKVRIRLENDLGRKGDLQTLARLVDLPMPALAQLYDEITQARHQPHATDSK